MKLSENWLREWVNPPLSCQQVADHLTMAGLEVEDIDQQADDNILDIALTPNRGDCLSVQGIARELSAVTDCPLTAVNCLAQQTSITDQLSVSLKQKEHCPHYIGRVIRAVDNQRATPDWLEQRLKKSGIGSISSIVDITNYVLLELGQPMHAFDLAKINGNIQVRAAMDDETLTLLDDKLVKLSVNELVIADDEKALALAGIMGGLASSVSEVSTDIFLESAFFEPVNIALTRRRHHISTDSSYRFERGVDPKLQQLAIERATQLIVEICGGEVGPLSVALAETHLPQSTPIQLRPQRVNKIIGTVIEEDVIRQLLQRLAMKIDETKNVWQVSVPSYRFDLSIEEDLIEEVTRLKGYDSIPAKALSGPLAVPAVAAELLSTHAMKDLLKTRAYHEAITYSFVEPGLQKLFNPDEPMTELANPVSNEMAVMRTNLWPGLVKVAQHNLNRQVNRLRLFEIGACFLSTGEQQVIAGLLLGAVDPEQWGQRSRQLDFFDVKGDVEAMLALGHGQFTFEKAEHPALHPGRSAKVCLDGQMIGLVGAIHPQLATSLELPTDTYLFELLLSTVTKLEPVTFQNLSKFPSIRRDLSLLVDQTVCADQIVSIIRQSAGQWLEKVLIFDVYQGEKIQIGKKSVALGLILQDFSRTLVDEEIDKLLTCVIAALERQCDAKLRM